MKLSRRVSGRRLKAYVFEFIDAEMEVEIDEDGDAVMVEGETFSYYVPAIAHGPEHAIKCFTFDEIEATGILSIRRVRNGGLFRAILTPEDERWDLHHAQLQELMEEQIRDE